ncbi:MAG: phage holin family protein [Streptosporangiaceae bacterium]
MVRSETPEPVGGDQSLGDLVALAAKDASQLIRYEIDLAKSELRDDVRRIGMAVVLVGGAAFAGCLVLVILCFALAEGLVVLGLSRWEAFLAVAVALVLLAAAAIGIALLRVRNMTGLRKTRKTVTEGLEMLRQDGQQPEIAARETG